ncbi:unnamed protein product [Ciceribacter selenitireducens ATCC BAA-1503]|uniref:Cytochrome c domain-containing protein n=2 Tax=Ciceribacter selenitireducens TaxID=448181 RepID=A0A376ABT5_9HYPH|nr:unnamed protein product [Ciceribacter selenitireducens ATCC BAA-1503]
MPSYPFLFEVKDSPSKGDKIVDLPVEYAPGSGVVVAKADAISLVAYLKSLDRTYPAPTDSLRDDGYSTVEAETK